MSRYNYNYKKKSKFAMFLVIVGVVALTAVCVKVFSPETFDLALNHIKNFGGK